MKSGLIRREDVLKLRPPEKRFRNYETYNLDDAYDDGWYEAIQDVADVPTVNAVEVPEMGIGDLSDGYHTFNELYHQRLILFAALVKAYKDRAWKSYRHEDGELCFGGGWFIVGIDTPEGSYTYHYENKDFDLFDCEELPVGKHWDGHTEDDVTRLLSLPVDAVEVVHAKWEESEREYFCYRCSNCKIKEITFSWEKSPFCSECGAKMDL